MVPMRKIQLLALTLPLLLSAAGSVEADAIAGDEPSDRMQYQIVKFEKTLGEGDSVFCCASLQAEYPEFIGGASPYAIDVVNAFVRYFLPVSAGLQPGFTLDQMADRRLRVWHRQKENDPRQTVGTAETFKVSMMHNANGLLCLEFYWWSSGGAHPVHRTSYVNFELTSGRRLELSDLLAPGYEAKLDSLAESEFRSERNISPDSSLETAGYKFKEGNFSLPTNFAVDTAGILFYYNEYEIAAYVNGPQQLRLSFEAIAGLIPHNGYLARIAH
jgi:hypothetical protein